MNNDKSLSILTIVSMIGCSCGFLAQVGLFGDGPIHPCTTHGFCNKFGAAATPEHYHAFELWSPRLRMAFAAFIGIAFISRIAARIAQKRP